MKYKTIFIVIKSNKDLINWQKITKYLDRKIKFIYLTNFSVINCKICYINLYDDFKKFKFNLPTKLNAQLAAYNEANVKYKISHDTYKSDERFFLRTSDERDLIFEQYYLIQKLKNIFKDVEDSILISAGGGSLIRRVTFNMAKSFGMPSYRMLSANHMSIKRTGMRLFFVDNDFNELPSKKIFKKHNNDEIEFYAKNFVNSIKKKNYIFDSYSKNTARFFRESDGIYNALLDFIRSYYFLILNDKLSAKKNKLKFIYFFRSFFLKFYFYKSDEVSAHPYIIFPLNVPDDAQLRLRAKPFVDTEAVIKIIASGIPYGYNLIVKPHPGNPGMLSCSAIRRIIKDYPFIKFVNPSESLFDLIKNSRGLIAINSNSALEAAILKKPVIYLGRSYLASFPNCIKLSSFDEIEDAIRRLINYKNHYNAKNYNENLTTSLSEFYGNTFPYFNKQAKQYNENLELIADAIIALISEIS